MHGGQLGHGRPAAGQTTQDGAANGIRDRSKRGIEPRWILNHGVKYRLREAGRQGVVEKIWEMDAALRTEVRKPYDPFASSNRFNSRFLRT
jgi:hypothetical protein